MSTAYGANQEDDLFGEESFLDEAGEPLVSEDTEPPEEQRAAWMEWQPPASVLPPPSENGHAFPAPPVSRLTIADLPKCLQRAPSPPSAPALVPVTHTPGPRPPRPSLADPQRPAQCPHCRDARWVVDDRTAEAVPCPACRSPQTVTDPGLTTWEPLSQLTFATFDCAAPAAAAMHAAARDFAQDPHGWLVLVGAPEAGPTHLAAAVAHAVREAGRPVLHAALTEFLDKLRPHADAPAPPGYGSWLAAAQEVPVLVLVDIDAVRKTPWAMEKLYLVVNRRYNYQQPTVFTLTARQDLDPRISSRLADWQLSTMVVMESLAQPGPVPVPAAVPRRNLRPHRQW